jgi:hypothetical protein
MVCEAQERSFGFSQACTEIKLKTKHVFMSLFYMATKKICRLHFHDPQGLRISTHLGTKHHHKKHHRTFWKYQTNLQAIAWENLAQMYTLQWSL